MSYNITPFEKLPLRHNFMFGQVMQDEHICKLFLEALFGQKVEKIKYIVREKEIKDRSDRRGVRMDVYLHASDKVYNIEMQAADRGNLERRFRFYQSGLDREEVRLGAYFENLPESFIIFVCDYDPVGTESALYERVSYWKDEDRIYDDGSHVIVLNSHYKKGNASPAILEFLDYIRTDDGTAEYTSELANEAKNKVERIRLDKEVGERFMTLEMLLHDYKNEGIAIGRAEGHATGLAEGRTEGEAKKLIDLICKKLRKGKSIEVIADELEEDISVIKEIYDIAKLSAPDYNTQDILKAWR